MVESNPRLEEDTAYAMLAWVARWGERFADNQGRVVLYDNIDLQNAMDLLAENGVFKKEDQFEFSFITSKPDMKKPYDLEDILYVFHQLGAWYGYGIDYQEQGFKAAPSMAHLFENLIQLGYCAKSEDFYVWTEKTFRLKKRHWAIYTLKIDDYLELQKKKFLKNRVYQLVQLDPKIKIEAIETDEQLQEFVETWVKNKWRETPTVWPDTIKID